MKKSLKKVLTRPRGCGVNTMYARFTFHSPAGANESRPAPLAFKSGLQFGRSDPGHRHHRLRVRGAVWVAAHRVANFPRFDRPDQRYQYSAGHEFHGPGHRVEEPGE